MVGDMKEQKKITLANLQQWVDSCVHNCELNHKDPSEVEFIIMDSTERKEYRPFSSFLSWGSNGTKAGIEFFRSDVIRFDPKDERPAVGEYWKSRGASSFDVSGFITSKAAGVATAFALCLVWLRDISVRRNALLTPTLLIRRGRNIPMSMSGSFVRYSLTGRTHGTIIRLSSNSYPPPITRSLLSVSLT